MPKTIGYIIDTFPQLSESFIYNEVRGLLAEGYDVRVFSLNRPRPEQTVTDRAVLDAVAARTVYLQSPLPKAEAARGLLAEGLRHPVRLTRTLRYGAQISSDYRWVARQAASYMATIAVHGCEHLHVHFAGTAARFALIIARHLGLPLTMTTHGSDIFEAAPGVIDVVGVRAKMVLTVSEYNKRYMVEEFGLPPEKVTVNPNGIHPEFFSPGPFDQRRPAEIVTVARLHPVKGLPHALAAAALLRQRQIDFHWSFVGDGPDRDALEQQAAALNLGGHVSFLGGQPSPVVRRELQTAAMFVLPSLSESQGVVYLEAMATATPVVGTDVLGVSETVLHGTTGFLVPPAEPEALAQHITELLADPALRQRMGDAGRDRVVTHFDIKDTLRRLTETWAERR